MAVALAVQKTAFWQQGTAQCSAVVLSGGRGGGGGAAGGR